MTNEELVKMIQAGENQKEYMLQLWLQVKGFVFKLAKQYSDKAELEDLVQEGYIGVCKAVERYNPEKGVLFLSYAGHWIKMQMSRYVYADRVIHIPEYELQCISRYHKYIQEYQSNYHEMPTDTEIMKELGIKRAKLEDIRKTAAVVTIKSIHEVVGEDEELLDILPDNNHMADNIIELLSIEKNKTVLWQQVEELPYNESTAVIRYYKENKTYKEIAQEQSVSLERARQMIRSGLRKLSCKRIIKEIAEDYGIIYSLGLSHNGISTFRRSNTSSTEYAAMKLLELDEIYEKMTK